ncbi:MAG TPA: PaaI family thioesterase [Streptosporangiaceae bacterium]|nr:PaaI family thioesterase [Streptosporangiaceae bacterium]
MTEPEGTRGPERTAAPSDKGVDAAVAAARRVIASLLHAGDRSAAEMAKVAEQLNAVADHLDAHAPTMAERMADMWRGVGVTRHDPVMTRHDPVTGPQNAIAPPLHLYGKEDGSVEGVVVLGMPYQGPPACVHGGVSALLLDHVLGVANHWGRSPGMTAELTLRYHRLAPLFTPLTVTGRQLSVDGRKIRAAGAIYAEGKMCVSAEGLFIAKQIPSPC